MLNTLGVKATMYSLTKHNAESIAVATVLEGFQQHYYGVKGFKETPTWLMLPYLLASVELKRDNRSFLLL